MKRDWITMGKILNDPRLLGYPMGMERRTDIRIDGMIRDWNERRYTGENLTEDGEIWRELLKGENEVKAVLFAANMRGINATESFMWGGIIKYRAMFLKGEPSEGFISLVEKYLEFSGYIPNGNNLRVRAISLIKGQ